ncbi:hypothetical protein O181_100047 [Austropuccinia psidii MF-1]|uniref:Extracellular membrane protein CFEM domain-containing protein n=1 Tax=Austropuccinia psidii MF-1 TaxID=1389203 RepID=A0A9Q3PH50_9BASI|nr:hypothetical protein [Austropuccinia psidii MF-1]
MLTLYPCSYILIIIISTLLDSNLAKFCCSADSTCSGCWMCPGSPLLSCVNEAKASLPSCHQINDLQEKAKCFCKGYAANAKCWSAGRCCTEYAPTLNAATNLCNLATRPSNLISKDELDRAIHDAENVCHTIWHNDSGWNVPKLSVYTKAYSGTSDQNHSSQSKEQNQQTWSQKPPKISPTHPDTPYNHPKLAHFQKQIDLPTTIKPKKTSNLDKSNHHFSSFQNNHHIKFSSKNDKNFHQNHTPHQERLHHQAKIHKCKSKDKNGKCCNNDFQKYHHAANDKHHHSHQKRHHNSLNQLQAYHSIGASLLKRGAPTCGTDFHGVAYPKDISSVMKQAFSMV